MLAEKLEDKIGLAASTYTGYDLYHAAVHANLEVVEVFIAFYLHKLLPLIYCLIMTQAAKTGSFDVSMLPFTKTIDDWMLGNRDAVQTGGRPALLSISTGFSRESCTKSAPMSLR